MVKELLKLTKLGVGVNGIIWKEKRKATRA